MESAFGPAQIVQLRGGFLERKTAQSPLLNIKDLRRDGSNRNIDRGHVD
jgi:hypothetical protein